MSFLNAYLHSELKAFSDHLEIFCFNNIPDGLKHFAEITKVKADTLPTPEEAEEIKKEQSELPPVSSIAGWEGAVITAVRAGRYGLNLSPMPSPYYYPAPAGLHWPYSQSLHLSKTGPPEGGAKEDDLRPGA
jgi:hypothetical protein